MSRPDFLEKDEITNSEGVTKNVRNELCNDFSLG